jgi:thymidine kinase
MIEIDSYDVIVIDEAQFFTNLKKFVQHAVCEGKHVIVAGLDGDFKQDVFGEILSLIPIADTITKLYALCMKCRDGTVAPFTKRIISCSEQELVGDHDSYMAVCRKCLCI